MRRGESRRQSTLVISSRGVASIRIDHARDIAILRETNVSRSSCEWRVSIGVCRRLECIWWHGLSVKGGREWLSKGSLISTTGCSRRDIRLLLGWWASLTLCGSADSNRARTDAAGSLETERRAGEGSRVNGGHPDSRLVDFEEICNERVEVDVSIGEVVESELLPVPIFVLA